MRSPLNKFIGSQRSTQSARAARVPAFGPEDDPWYALTGKNPFANKLPEPRKKQLLGILEKEKNKEKRERIAYVLTRKFAAKFGARHEPVILFFVEELLSSKENVSNDDLTVLEKEISSAIRAKDEAAANAKLRATPPAANGNTAATSTATASRTPPSTAPAAIESAQPRERPPTGKEWAIIQAYQSLQEEEEAKQKLERARQTKNAFRNALDSQINAMKSLDSAASIDEQRYVAHMQQDILSFHEENRRKAEAQKKKHIEELLIRREQIEDQKRRAEKERESLRLAEEYNKQLAQQAIEREQKALQDARHKEHLRQLRIEHENAENKRIREAERRREAMQDQQLMREYAAKLDREAAEREEAFSKRMKEMERHGAKFENEGAGKALREEQLRFEQLLLKEQARKEAEDLAKEKKKLEDQQQRVREALRENQRQLAQKAESRRLDKELDAQLKERFQHETEAFVRLQEEQRRKQRTGQVRYRDQLNAQVDEVRRSDTRLQGITPQEKQLNQSTLRQIEDDPVLLSKIMHRMRLSKSRPALK